jgi:hypothetical protein
VVFLGAEVDRHIAIEAKLYIFGMDQASAFGLSACEETERGRMKITRRRWSPGRRIDVMYTHVFLLDCSQEVIGLVGWVALLGIDMSWVIHYGWVAMGG